MTSVAVLIPVLARPHRVEPLVRSLVESDRRARPVFLCSPGDTAEIRAVEVMTGAERVVVDWQAGPGDYARKMNHGFAVTDDEYVFLGADDLRFHPGWLDAAFQAQAEACACVVGTNDLGNSRVISGRHSTHSLVHREYGEWGTIDDRTKIIHEGYDHQFCNPPDAPIWMADLSFKPLGDVRVGDEVVGWACDGTFCSSTVLATSRRWSSLVGVRMDSGREFRCTPDHRWLNAAWSPSAPHWSPGLDRFRGWVTPAVGRALLLVADTSAPSQRDDVVAVQPDGEGEVVSMTTTTGNYVAWGYASRNCDDEFVQTAQARDVFTFAAGSYVEHLHPHWRKAETDATYEKGQRAFDADRQLFESRRPLWAGSQRG